MGLTEEEEEQDPEVPDAALIDAARDGRVAALETLLRRHEGRVLRLMRLLGVPAIDREDVAQEVFVRVFRHLDGYRRDHPFSAWVYRISVNAVHDYWRQARSRSLQEVSWSEGLHASSPDHALGPGERLEHLERRRRLDEALDVLSERERAVFVLREIEGLESRVVARALGISSITVRRHLGRARRHLQDALAAVPKKIEED